MKSLLLITASVLAFGATANATKYECKGKANPDRGYPAAFSVVIEPAEVGGTITFKMGGRVADFGQITDSASIDSKHPAFWPTMSLIGEEDISGLTRDQEANIGSIVIWQKYSEEGDEIAIYQILDKSGRQIGGTFSKSGYASACF